jgi:hypothetical protein
LHEKLEHVTKDTKGYGMWSFDDLRHEQQKMVLAVYPDFNDRLAQIHKKHSNRADILKQLGGYGLKLLDDNTVVVKEYDNIDYSKLLSKRYHLNLGKGYNIWQVLVQLVNNKINGKYGEDHIYQFEDAVKDGTWKEKYPFVDEEMADLVKNHRNYRSSSALSHGIGRAMMPQFIKILYEALAKYNTEEFRVVLKDGVIHFVTSYDNVINEYKKHEDLKGLEERYAEWRKGMDIDWEEVMARMGKVERAVDKEAFKKALNGEKGYHAEDYSADRY